MLLPAAGITVLQTSDLFILRVHFNDHKPLFLTLMVYLVVWKLCILAKREMVLNCFYEQCQLQNGLNSLWLQRLITVEVKMLYHTQLKLFFLVIQSLFGTPLRLKLYPNYTIVESTRVIITICFSTILETQYKIPGFWVVFYFPISKIILDQECMLENISNKFFKADHIIWLLVEDADWPGLWTGYKWLQEEKPSDELKWIICCQFELYMHKGYLLRGHTHLFQEIVFAIFISYYM